MLRALAFVALGCLLFAGRLGAAELRKDLEYGRAAGESLKLDASVPDGSGPFPIAILVHGGGWRRGDKGGSTTPGDNADISPWFAPLTAANYTWFSINYRLAPAHPWPACYDDVLTAIRWVKAHAREFKGDPSRIALFGHSAGGQLVCLAAVQGDASTRVQAVVGFASVTDIEMNVAGRPEMTESLRNLFQLPAAMSPASLAVLRAASPVTHVKAGLPPFLLFHGDADPGVLHKQSENFQARVRATGGVCDLVTIKGGPHSLIAWDGIDPSYKEKMIAWLRTHLVAAPAGK